MLTARCHVQEMFDASVLGVEDLSDLVRLPDGTFIIVSQVRCPAPWRRHNLQCVVPSAHYAMKASQAHVRASLVLRLTFFPAPHVLAYSCE